jgi:radical SAM-linked protein
MRGDAGFPMRLRFAKRGRIRFISHRDVARAFERALRVVKLPVSFTRGFSPRPKVSFGLALTLGYESDAEYLDVELVEPVEVESVIDPLSSALPPGLDVTGAGELRDRAPALQAAVTTVCYRIELDGSTSEPSELAGIVHRAMGSSSLLVARKRKGLEVTDDIRPAIRSLDVTGHETLELEVNTQPRGVRPGEVISALGADLSVQSVLRTHQWIERASARLEPLEADTRLRVPEARAS